MEGYAAPGDAKKPTPELDGISITGLMMDTEDVVNIYTYGLFLKRFAGIPNIVHDTNSSISIQYAGTAEVKAMPVYPEKGSIKVMDGNMLVKLGN